VGILDHQAKMILDAYQSGLEMEYLEQKEYRVDQESSVIFIVSDESRQTLGSGRTTWNRANPSTSNFEISHPSEGSRPRTLRILDRSPS
jgi:hypothetical protein